MKKKLTAVPSVMSVDRYVEYYYEETKKNTDNPCAVAAVNTMLYFIKTYKTETMVELQKVMREIIERLILDNVSMSVVSACELFVRFITMVSIDQLNFDECKKILIQRGEKFIRRCTKAVPKIGKLGHKFIKSGSKILTHGYSSTVLELLMEAMTSKKYFEVFVTEAYPDKSGYRMRDLLRNFGIPATLILDSAMGFVMERVDAVIVGSEGVVESGGILNTIGTNQMAVLASYMRIPFYVAVESYKFIRFFPLRQVDLPNINKYEKLNDDFSGIHPTIDYTPPEFIKFLFSDIGVLTPSAVSDELIRLYL